MTAYNGTAYNHCCALSNHAMRGGRHFATFHISGDAFHVSAPGFLVFHSVRVGIIRLLPGWDKKGLDSFNPAAVLLSNDVSRDLLAERTERWTSDVNCCVYDCYDGLRFWRGWTDRHGEQWEGGWKDWEGMESIRPAGTIGLQLDLDEGTLTVYKNGTRLGVMKEGLSGEYCWFTCVDNR